jgi:predicted GNAT family acetyltransferase
MDKNFEATKKINQITELTVKKYPGAYIKVQQQADSNYCAISTFVPENMRDKGVGKQLYKELIK